jgi:hypothetical protein
MSRLSFAPLAKTCIRHHDHCEREKCLRRTDDRPEYFTIAELCSIRGCVMIAFRQSMYFPVCFANLFKCTVCTFKSRFGSFCPILAVSGILTRDLEGRYSLNCFRRSDSWDSNRTRLAAHDARRLIRRPTSGSEHRIHSDFPETSMNSQGQCRIKARSPTGTPSGCRNRDPRMPLISKSRSFPNRNKYIDIALFRLVEVLPSIRAASLIACVVPEVCTSAPPASHTSFFRLSVKAGLKLDMRHRGTGLRF